MMNGIIKCTDTCSLKMCDIRLPKGVIGSEDGQDEDEIDIGENGDNDGFVFLSINSNYNKIT